MSSDGNEAIPLPEPLPSRSLTSGPLPSGPLPSGPLPSGPLPSGPLPSGPLPSGPLPSGPLPSGPLPSGPPTGLSPASPLLSPPPGDPTRSLHSISPSIAHPTVASALFRAPERYEILNEHGRGGLGKVSRAHDRELGRDVAIKELIARTTVSEARFLREAKITARLVALHAQRQGSLQIGWQ